MKTRQVVAILIVISVISLALGAKIGYNISSGRTSTLTQTGKTSTTTQTHTVTTSIFLGSSSVSTTNDSSKNFLFNETLDVGVDPAF